MFQEIKKSDLEKLPENDLNKMHKTIVLTSLLERYLKESKELNLDNDPQKIFGEKKIEDLKAYIENYNGESKEFSVLTTFYDMENESIELFSILDYKNNEIQTLIHTLLETPEFERELNYDNAKQFNKLLKENFNLLNREIITLSMVASYERKLYFYKLIKNKSIMLANYLLLQLNYSEENLLYKEASLRQAAKYFNDAKSIVSKGFNKPEVVANDDKKGFFSSFKKKDENEKSSYDIFADTLEGIFNGYIDYLFIILNASRVLNDPEKNTLLKNGELIARNEKYLSNFIKIEEYKIIKILNKEDTSSLLEKEKKLSKQILINNILNYSKYISITEIKELGKYF